MPLPLPAWYRSVLLQRITRCSYSVMRQLLEPQWPRSSLSVCIRLPHLLVRVHQRAYRASFISAGITCFATVGMFSAVSNLGAGGTQDTALVDTSNGVLYGMFALTGLVSGGINNRAFFSLIR